MKIAEGAIVIDCSEKNIQEVVDELLRFYQQYLSSREDIKN